MNPLTFFTETTYGRIIFFLIKLFVVFFILDTFLQFLIGASVEGGLYLPILSQFNLAEIYRDLLLQAGGWVVSLAGYEYHITGKLLKIDGGSGVILGYSCYGFSVISMYMALILAYHKAIKTKVFFLISGILAIIFLNILRIGGLAIIYTKTSDRAVRDIDHHLVFNIIVYILIFGLFYWYVNKGDDKLKVQG